VLSLSDIPAGFTFKEHTMKSTNNNVVIPALVGIIAALVAAWFGWAQVGFTMDPLRWVTFVVTPCEGWRDLIQRIHYWIHWDRVPAWAASVAAMSVAASVLAAATMAFIASRRPKKGRLVDIYA
jgi:hypothetical protein